MALMMPVHGIQLSGHQEPDQAQRAGPPHLRINVRGQQADQSGAVDQLSGDVQLPRAGRPATLGIERRTAHGRTPRSMRWASSGAAAGTNESRSDNTVTPA